jgi:hypothetical protein
MQYGLLIVPALAAFLLATVALTGCEETRLVEQFDNGPVGGPQGPSEGIRRVGVNELPPTGKSWQPVESK